MKFEITEIFNRSVTIELCNDYIYETPEEYEVLINGEHAVTSKQNVISVSDLEPDTEYTLSLVYQGTTEKQSFTTLHETVLFNVLKFGATGDGVTNDTAAIQAAILSAPAGSTIYFPKGTYLCTPLFLKSNLTLYVAEGATILGETNRELYPILPGMTLSTDEKSEINLSSWEGNPLTSFASLITGMDVENVDIIGPGTIDGNAQNGDWWINAKVKNIAWRPNTVYFCRCKNIRMQGLTVQNSPCWTLHPYYSDHLSFINLYIHNPSDSPNTDGLDPESCSDIRVIGTTISVGDDCIAIKSGKFYMAANHYKRTENMTVRNCKFERGHGSVTVGSEAAGGVDGIFVDRCIFDGTDRGLRIKTRRGRGEKSFLDNILFQNIKMNGVHMPFTVNMFYFCDPDGHSDYVQNQEAAPVDVMTPKIGSITARNIDCTDVGPCMICVYGLPEMPVEHLTIENVNAQFLPEADIVPDRPVMMDNFDKMTGRSIFARNIDTLTIKNVHIKGALDEQPELIYTAHREIENLTYEK